MFDKARWIWTSNDSRTNERANFFFDLEVAHIPKTAELLIGCETKYWLFVNGEAAVFDGGLFRESSLGNGYYDSIDISKYLKIGKNSLVIHVWYYGNGGRNNSVCSKAGLIVAVTCLACLVMSECCVILTTPIIPPLESQPVICTAEIIPPMTQTNARFHFVREGMALVLLP